MSTSRPLRLMFAALVVSTAITSGSAIAEPRRATTTTPHVAVGFDLPYTGDTMSNEALVQTEEQRYGHAQHLTRLYFKWDSYKTFPQSWVQWLIDRGTTPLISVKSLNIDGSLNQWSDIAAATPTAHTALYNDILGWRSVISQLHGHVYFTFDHEPTASIRRTQETVCGCNDEQAAPAYRGAWNNIWHLFRQGGLSENGSDPAVRFLWIMTAYEFGPAGTNGNSDWTNWFPGDSTVWGAGIDPYNDPRGCLSSSAKTFSLQQLLQPFMAQFAASYPKMPLLLTEVGSNLADGADPAVRQRWIGAVQTLLEQPSYTKFVGLAYYDANIPSGCKWVLDAADPADGGDQSSQAAMQNLMGDRYYMLNGL